MSIFLEPRTRLHHDCDVAVRADIIEKRISHGRGLVATAAAAISQMKKRVAGSDKALIEMEGRWSYVAAADDGSPKNHGIFGDRVDDARAFRTELEAEFAIKSKRLVEYQEEILKQLSVMETDLAALNAEKRNVMTPLPGLGIQIDADDFLPRLGMENDGDYYRTLRTAWADAEKRASVAGLNRHPWPVYRALSSVEYAKELMLHLSNIIHQAGSGKRELVQEIDKRDGWIREKGILLAEKDAQVQEQDAQIRDKDAQIREQDAQIRERDAQIQEKDGQIREKDAQIRDKDAHIARIHPRIVEVEVSDELLECQLCKKKTKFGKRIGRDQTLACLECISQA